MSRRRIVTTLMAAGCAASVAVSGAQAAAAATSGSGAVPTTPTATSCPSPGGVKIAEAPTPKGAVKIYGHGWGHGMGMSQYGAQGAARLGCGYRTILKTYYRDSKLSTRSLDAPVRLALGTSKSAARLVAESGSVRWVGSGATATQPKGSTWTVVRATFAGRRGIAVLDEAGTRQVFVAGTAALYARHSGTVVTVRPNGGSGLQTRWDSARFNGSKNGITTTEVISGGQGYTAVQKYLMGLGEVPVSWPAEALKSQVVAARTYLASKYDGSAKAYVLGTTTAHQVYRGFSHEVQDARYGGGWRRAVTATAGQIIVDSTGRTIEAMYSSSMGGHTENRQYVYGRYGISYLKAVDDSRWDSASDNPYRRWSKGFTTKELAAKFGFESVSSWKIAKRGSADRLAGVQITGKRDGRTVTVSFTGSEARWRLGLRSPGFTFGSK